MWLCKKHGYCDIDWCEYCETILKCDHMDPETVKREVIVYPDHVAEFFIRIMVKYCGTCGKGLDVSLKDREG